MSEWPFEVWLKYAVNVLGLPPSEFWKLSVCDWLSLSMKTADQGIDRTHLEGLMQSFPDKK